MAKRKAFKITGGKGFHITFPNGVTLSTQFGFGNYCDNYDLKATMGADVFKYMRENDIGCDDCEIMMWVGDTDGAITGEWSKNDDTVQGRVNINQWLSAFDFARNYKVK